MHRLARAYFEWVVRHPRLTLAIVAAMAIAAAVPIVRITRDASPDAFLPRNHPARIAKAEVDRIFGLEEPIVVAIDTGRPDGFFAPHPVWLLQWLTREILEIPGLEEKDILSLDTQNDVIWRQDLPELAPFLEPMPESPEAYQKLRTAPDFKELRKKVFAFRELYRGSIVSADGSSACVIIYPRNDSEAASTYLAVHEIARRAPLKGERLHIAGEAAVRAYMGYAIDRDGFRLNPGCFLIVSLFLFLSFRAARGVLIPICVVAGGALWAVGSMSAAGIPIYIITNSLVAIIMALGVADSIHLLGQYYEELLDRRGRDRRRLVADANSEIWLPVLITTLTDMVGFLSIFIAGLMPPMEYYGLFAAIGVLGALVYSYTVVPASLALIPLRMSPTLERKRKRVALGFDRLSVGLGGLGRVVHRRPGRVLAVGCAILLFAGWASSHLRLNYAEINTFKRSSEIVAADRFLGEAYDGVHFLDVVVDTDRDGGVLEPAVLRRIDALEAYARGLEWVGTTVSPAGFAKKLSELLNRDDPEFFRIPDTADDVEDYFELVEESDKATELRHVADPKYRRANIRIRLKTGEFIHTRGVVEAMEDYLAEQFAAPGLQAKLAGRVYVNYHWLLLIRKSAVQSTALALVGVTILLILSFRSIVAGLIGVIPVGSAVLVTYAVMGLAGIDLGPATAMFAAIAIGCGVDFPIHMLDRLRAYGRRLGGPSQETYQSTFAFTGRALLFNASSVSCGFLILLLSELPILIHFGILIGVGIMTSFIASLTILPAIVRGLKPRFLFARTGGGSLPPADGESR